MLIKKRWIKLTKKKELKSTKPLKVNNRKRKQKGIQERLIDIT